MDVTEFIHETVSATTAQQLQVAYERALAQLGYDRLMYSVVAASPQAGGIDQPICIASTYPVEWLAYYQKENYQDKDPLRRYGRLQRRVFSWDDLARQHRLSRSEKAILREAEDAGLYSGAAVPLHGPGGEVLGVAVAASQRLDERADRLSYLSILTAQFHAMSLALRDRWAPPPSTPVLTARECEVLKWAAQGKSNWTIGELLNISEHGVDYHFRNILKKLSADSRVTAVVKALYYGLI